MEKSKYFRIIVCYIIILIIASVALVLCGDFKNDSKVTINEDEKSLINVGFTQVGLESGYRIANTASVQNALSRENGFITQFNNGRQMQENQIKAIRGYISQSVDYIVLSPITEDGYTTVLKEAKSAGIPVILQDRKVNQADSDLYSVWIGSDMRTEGEKAAEWLETYLLDEGRSRDQINIVVLQGTIGSSAQLGRTMGFDSVSDRHENWKILEQKSGDFTTTKGEEVMKYFINKYGKDIDVVVSQNDSMTFGAIDALNEAGYKTGEDGDIILISFDAVHDALEMVSSGIINVDVECNPETGDLVKDVILRMEKGEEVSKEILIDEMVFTKENVDKYLETRTY